MTHPDQDKIIINDNVVMVIQNRWMRLHELDPGTLHKMWSDKADSLTFLSIPFKYHVYKKMKRFLVDCLLCLRRKQSWKKWRRHIREDKQDIRRLIAELRTIDQFLELVDHSAVSSNGVTVNG